MGGLLLEFPGSLDKEGSDEYFEVCFGGPVVHKDFELIFGVPEESVELSPEQNSDDEFELVVIDVLRCAEVEDFFEGVVDKAELSGFYFLL